MRHIVILSCAVALLLSSAADADVLKLASGGDLPGTVEEVVFLSEGKEHRLAGATIVSILISPISRDVLELKDDVKLRGELISVTFKSLGGVLLFKRKELTEVIFDEMPEENRLPQNPAPQPNPGTGDGTRQTGDLTPKPPVRDNVSVNPPAEPKEKPKVDPEKVAALKEALAKNEDLRKTYHDTVDKKLQETTKEIEEKWKQRTPGIWVRLNPTEDRFGRDTDLLVYTEDLTLADIQERIQYLKVRLRWIADRIVLRTREEVDRREEYRREQDRLERELRLANEKLGKILEAIRAELNRAAKAAALKKTALNVVHDRQRYSMIYGGKLLAAPELEAGYRAVIDKDDGAPIE